MRFPRLHAKGASAAPAALPRQRPVRIALHPLWLLNFGMMTALLLIDRLHTKGALLYLLMGMTLLALRPAVSARDIWRYWPVMLLPLWCLLSFVWSAYPAITLRYGIQLFLTFAFSVVIASRLSPRDFVLGIFSSYMVAAVLSVLIGHVRADGNGWEGVFGSKNAFALSMAVLVLLTLAVALDARLRLRYRLAAWFCVLFSVGLLLLGHSAGATITSLAGAVTGVALATLRPLRPRLRVVVVVALLLLMSIVIVVATAYLTTLQHTLLTTTGKDVTLTGRTDLWHEALIQIRKHPLLGQGYQAVWVVGNPIAEQLWHRFGIGAKAGFHFHDTWLSNAVEIGIIGEIMQAALFFSALWLSLRWALASPRVELLFFAMFMVTQSLSSLVEVVAYQQFQPTGILATCALIYGVRAHQALKAASRPPARAAPGMAQPAAP